MWALQLHIPAFYWIFSQTPSLWMDWVFYGDRVSRQSRATRFAINLWLDMHDRSKGSAPYVNIRVVSPPVSYTQLMRLFPTTSIPFIRSIDIIADRSALTPFSIRLFLERFPSLTHVGVDDSDRILGTSGLFGPPPSIAIFTESFIHDAPSCLELRPILSLSLNGVALSVDALNNITLSECAVVRLTDQVIRGNALMSLHTILQHTPKLRELVAHMHWLQPIGYSRFWTIPSRTLLPHYLTELRYIDLAGDKREVLDMINFLTDPASSQLVEINLVLYCDSSDDWPTFMEVPSFTSELTSNADDIDIEGSTLRISSRRSSTRYDAVRWRVQWKLVTISSGFWVSRFWLFSQYFTDM